MNVRQKFPDEASVLQHIKVHASEFVTTLSKKLSDQEEEYVICLQKKRLGDKYTGIGFILLMVLYVSLHLLAENIIQPSLLASQLIFGGLIAVLVIGVICIRKGWMLKRNTKAVIQQFNHGVNEELFPLAFSMFNVPASWVPHAKTNPTDATMDWYEEQASKSIWRRELIPRAGTTRQIYKSPEYQQVQSLLEHSELITEPANRVIVDDMVSATISGRTLFTSELHAQHVTDSGKSSKTKEIFKGYFVSFDLPRTLEGKTFVSTNGDTKGFGHQLFYGRLLSNQVKPTSLEWNEFENLLHVATSNETEARYILTPNFMSDLYDWWVTKKMNIRISFISNRMYILFPDKNIKINKTLDTLTQEAVGHYLASIAMPLLHVLHLIEDVEENVR